MLMNHWKQKLCLTLAMLLLLTCTGCGNLFYQVVFGDEYVLPSEAASSSGETPSSMEETPSGEALPSAEHTPSGETPLSSEEHTLSGETPSSSVNTTAEPSGESSFEETPDPVLYPYTFEAADEIVYTTDSLNVRTAPSTDAESIAVLAANRPLQRIGYHEEWSQVIYKGTTAYVSSLYVTTTVPPLSNKTLQFGYNPNGERDAQNVPTAMYWYINNWGHDADFVLDTSEKTIYLTMDEGYEYGFTPTILDTLKEKQVTAVFFVTKGFVESSPELVQRMIDEGHIIGNHSSTHPAKGMPSLSPEEQKEDIMTLHQMVLDQFDYEMSLFRFPAGLYSDSSLQIAASLGYRSVFWSFAHRDFEVDNQPDPEETLAMCIRELHPGAIYLLHAVSETNTEILGDWIDAARAQGYEFGVYPVD